mmetsp:Transcript_106325/g.184812  ORF Transcript_106325/g.184812 Transcript_106325/m.184812 type:complete len:114 (-) Transcript_106325:137-478(-)
MQAHGCATIRSAEWQLLSCPAIPTMFTSMVVTVFVAQQDALHPTQCTRCNFREYAPDLIDGICQQACTMRGMENQLLWHELVTVRMEALDAQLPNSTATLKRRIDPITDAAQT